MLLLPVVVLAVGMSGCTLAAAPARDGIATVPVAGQVEVAEIVDGFDCQAPNLRESHADPLKPNADEWFHAPAPAAGSIPDGFEPVAVHLCHFGGDEDADGWWSSIEVESYHGDLALLVDALETPDVTGYAGACNFDYQSITPVWLVDADGDAIRVHWPLTGCDKAQPAVDDALRALDKPDTTVLSRTLLQSREAIDTYCSPEYNTPVVAPAGTPEYLAGASDMAWCRYTVDERSPAADKTGTFTAGGTLSVADVAMILPLVTQPSALGQCEGRSDEFVTLGIPGTGAGYSNSVSVWLDGCESSEPDDTRAAALPGEFSSLFD
ncbi:MAG: hypothetical protein JWQ43_667 [Glaciihabitans sp.]|nr:hypothetical protein [Glaciihabitans sp.]